MTMHAMIWKTKQQKKKRLHPMFAAALALLFAFSAPAAFADDRSGAYGHAGGGYTGPGPGIVTVEQAKSMRDDSLVALKGYIFQSLGNEEYMFKDATGAITVEIDHDEWAGQQIGPDDLVELHGEVDKDWMGIEIDVDRIIKQ